MRYLCIVSLLPSADDDHKEKRGEVSAAEVVVLLQTGLVEKCFLTTSINAYLKKSISIKSYAKFRIFSSL